MGEGEEGEGRRGNGLGERRNLGGKRKRGQKIGRTEGK